VCFCFGTRMFITARTCTRQSFTTYSTKMFTSVFPTKMYEFLVCVLHAPIISSSIFQSQQRFSNVQIVKLTHLYALNIQTFRKSKLTQPAVIWTKFVRSCTDGSTYYSTWGIGWMEFLLCDVPCASVFIDLNTVWWCAAKPVCQTNAMRLVTICFLANPRLWTTLYIPTAGWRFHFCLK